MVALGGAAAEFCITLPENIARKPATLSHEAAASVSIGALTSWQELIDRAKLEPGQRVLVRGGAGAVGLYALQLGHIRGAPILLVSKQVRDVDVVASFKGSIRAARVGCRSLLAPIPRYRQHHRLIDSSPRFLVLSLCGQSTRASWPGTSVALPWWRVILTVSENQEDLWQRQASQRQP